MYYYCIRTGTDGCRLSGVRIHPSDIKHSLHLLIMQWLHFHLTIESLIPKSPAIVGSVSCSRPKEFYSPLPKVSGTACTTRQSPIPVSRLLFSSLFFRFPLSSSIDYLVAVRRYAPPPPAVSFDFEFPLGSRGPKKLSCDLPARIPPSKFPHTQCLES